MNKIILIFVLLITGFSFGQSPQGFKYQAVVRNADGVLLFNHVVSVKSSILADSPTGTAVYSETQTLATNEYGVVSLNVGEGTVLSGTFGSIGWGATTYFLKTELDLSGGSNFQFMGTSQIMSVPYALYAAKAGASLNDQDTSASNEIQTLSVSGNNLSISNGNEVVIDSNPTNELQSLSLNGNDLTISQGNTISIDNNPANEIQSLSLSGHDLTISDGNTVTLPPDSDSDPSNEFQTLSIVGDSLKLTNGNAVYLSGNVDLDASPTNELQQLSKSGDTVFLSNGNFVVLDHDADLDSTNELQLLSRSGDTLFLSNGNFVVLEHDTDIDSTNEVQSLAEVLLINNSANNHLITNVGNPINDGDATNKQYVDSIVGESLPNGNNVGDIIYFNGTSWISTNLKSVLFPTVSTLSITDVTQISATISGNVSSSSIFPIISRGVCWSNKINPTVSDSVIYVQNEIGDFNTTLNLVSNTQYHVRTFVENVVGIVYSSDSVINTPPFIIGQNCLGGILAYLLQSGDTGYDPNIEHGLIVASVDQGEYIWGCEGGACILENNVIGEGKNSTMQIINSCSDTNIGAYVCDTLNLGGYSDWYLPNYGEISKFDNLRALGLMVDGTYMSSNTFNQFYTGNFGSGNACNYSNTVLSVNGQYSTFSYNNKNSLSKVRAVRKF